MSRKDKILKKWRNRNNKQPVTLDEVLAVARDYFEIQTGKSGSHHTRLYSKYLEGMDKFSMIGMITITVKGNKVKKYKVEEILEAIDIITERRENEK